MKVSFSSVFLGVFLISPMTSAHFSKYSSSPKSFEIVGRSFVADTVDAPYVSTTGWSTMVIASFNFALSITRLLLEPIRLNDTFSSVSPSTEMLRALSTYNLYSSMVTAEAYSMISMSAAPSVTLDLSRRRMFLVFMSSSIKLKSLSYFRF